MSVGIPTDEHPEDHPVIPGWEVPLSRFFEKRGAHARTSRVVCVRLRRRLGGAVAHVPACVSGARRCPPEDCGGVHGYAEFLAAITTAHHPEHASMMQWSGGAYDPNTFNPEAVVFDDPRRRWQKAFER